MRGLRQFVAAAALGLCAPGCVASGSGTVAIETDDGATVEREPPPPQVEAIEVRPGFVWIRGRWVMRRGQWVWVGGRYERARVGYAWSPGRWDRRGDRWVWVEGRWVAR
ncbi:MAG TPA: YXWGXW repeat-containing protein [Kofleriaceae bacterium]|nr:YXWGXW repeat-containing protein [Kofleriaceae bacterium]